MSGFGSLLHRKAHLWLGQSGPGIHDSLRHPSHLWSLYYIIEWKMEENGKDSSQIYLSKNVGSSFTTCNFELGQPWGGWVQDSFYGCIKFKEIVIMVHKMWQIKSKGFFLFFLFCFLFVFVFVLILTCTRICVCIFVGRQLCWKDYLDFCCQATCIWVDGWRLLVNQKGKPLLL